MRSSHYLLAVTAVFTVLSIGLLGFLIWRGINQPQQAVPSKAAEGDINECQGNKDASAKCFDCRKDTDDDQVNVLDYSCFAKYYDQNVGK